MAELLKLPCGTTVECVGAIGGAHDFVAALEVKDNGSGGLEYLDKYDDLERTEQVALRVERRSLVPLIQWLTLLEQELRR